MFPTKEQAEEYGYYSQQKWDSNMALRKHFEQKMGMDLYVAVEKDSFRPE